MANLVKRRVPLRIAAPIQAQPSISASIVPKIRTILRASVITAGVVISVRNPHAIVAATSIKVPKPNVVTTPVRPRYNGYSYLISFPRTAPPVVGTAGKIRFVANTYRRNGSVLQVVPPKTNLPRATQGKVRVIGATYRRNGLALDVVPPRTNLPRLSRAKINFIGSSYRRLGSVVRTKSPLFTSNIPARPKKINVVGNTFKRDGKVYVIRHSNRVVVPVTTVRPKPVIIIGDIKDRFRRLLLPGSLFLSGPRNHVDSDHHFIGLLACINTTETWQDHFISRGWASPQAQIDAGYPLYIEPASLTGSYEEVVDYELVISNTIVTVRYAKTDIVGGISVVVKIATSLDNSTYTPFVAATSLFSPALRYVKYRLEFTANDDKSLAEISNLEFLIDVKTEIDSGTIIANATDVGGTQVFFNKAFKSVDSITLAVSAQEPVIPIYQFNSVPNPTSFFVFALDSSGNRTTYPVSWKARGVV